MTDAEDRAGVTPWTMLPTFALDADLTVYWPAVRPCWEDDARTNVSPTSDVNASPTNDTFTCG
jgi:hypothetical protein